MIKKIDKQAMRDYKDLWHMYVLFETFNYCHEINVNNLIKEVVINLGGRG